MMSGTAISVFYAMRDAVRSLWAYRLRTLLTGLGVAIGVATVIAILAIIEGLNVSFREQIAGMGTGTLYVTQRPWIILSDWWKVMKRPNLTKKEAEFLEERVSHAKVIVPFLDQRANVNVGRSTLTRVRIIGSTADWPTMAGIDTTEGRFLARGDVEASREVVVVGADVRAVMRLEGIDIGDKLRIGDRPVRVIGSMGERGRIFGKSQDDFVVVPLKLFERWFGSKRSLSIGVVVDPENLEMGTDEVTAALRTKRGLRPDQEDNFSINQQQMFVELYETLTRSLFATAIGLGIITLIVGGVGIMNIMLVAVAERTREIGIRKALGARPSAILLQFVVEASMVSGAGGAMGTILGIAMAKGVTQLTPLPAAVPPYAIGVGLLFGVLIGLMFGFVPAYRASRLIPVQALSTGDS
jgi:putative ABC transport system permease protein